MLSDAFLQRLDALSLKMKTPANGGAGGLRRSKALGSSVEFSDFRPYADGDDLRRVDWNAYARFDKLFLKLFMEEQEQHIHLVADASASMGFGRKWEGTRLLLETLAYLALNSTDTVTLYALTEDGEQHTRPLNGRYSYAQAAAFLEGLQPSGQAELNTLLPKLPLSSGRGVTVVVSDLLCEDGYDRALRSLLYRKQETTLLHLWSREEWAPDGEEALELEDSETGEKVRLDMSYDLLKSYRKAAADYQKAAEDYCRKNGVGYLFAIPEDGLEQRLLSGLGRIGLIG